jgi:hypothetical protein
VCGHRPDQANVPRHLGFVEHCYHSIAVHSEV